MNAPTPGAVRAAMKDSSDDFTEEEEANADEERSDRGVLADHIRAMADELRETGSIVVMAGGVGGVVDAKGTAKIFGELADKLEGKQ